MSATHTIRLNITNGVRLTDLIEFTQSAPASAEVKVETQVVKADRPYETDRVAVALAVEWTNP